MNNDEGEENTKEQESEAQVTFKNSYVQDHPNPIDSPIHKKYGNMLVVMETDRILVTLGPDCNSLLLRCFLYDFICMLDYFRLHSGGNRKLNIRKCIPKNRKLCIRDNSLNLMPASGSV